MAVHPKHQQPRYPHGLMLPIDPKGTKNRRWRCADCGYIAELGKMSEIPCDVKPNKDKQDRRLIAAIRGDPLSEEEQLN